VIGAPHLELSISSGQALIDAHVGTFRYRQANAAPARAFMIRACIYSIEYIQ
jgi:predicted ATP-grasp superfamily ATP-dependent carboligase